MLKLIVLITFRLLQQNIWLKQFKEGMIYFVFYTEIFLMLKTSWRQTHKAAGLFTSAVRVQSTANSPAELALDFLLSPGPQFIDGYHPHLEGIFPHELM